MRKSNRNLAIGTLVAAGIGYAAGILSAPKSGRETRRDIQRASIKAKTEAEKTLKKLHSELGDLITQGKAKARNVKDTAKKELVEALTKAQFAKEKARAILSAVHEGDADDKDLKKAITEVNKAIDHLKTYVGKTSQTKKAK